MFEQLVGSKATRQVDPRRGLVVAALHGLVIAGVVRATAQKPPAPDPPVYPISMVFYAPPAPIVADPAIPSAPVVTAPVVELPAAPVDLPLVIAPVTSGPVLDPALLRHVLTAGIPAPARGDSAVVGRVFAAHLVDDPAAVVHQPQPRYPPVLQALGVEGRVLVEFVIDTTGHLEAASLRIVESSNPGFNSAAAETVQRSIFRPARIGGRPVRQRTLQSILFRIAQH